MKNLTKVFRLLRIALWISAFLAFCHIGITCYFLITRDPIPYVAIGEPCSKAGADLVNLGCSDPSGPFRLGLYQASNIMLIAAVILTVISGLILILFSAEHNHTLEHREARSHNKVATITATVAVIIGLILMITYSNIAVLF
jgi:hypothetical protein